MVLLMPSHCSQLPSLTEQDDNGANPPKRKRSKKGTVEINNQPNDSSLDTSTLNEVSKTLHKKKQKKNTTSPEALQTPTRKKKNQQPQPQKNASLNNPSPLPTTEKPIKEKSCLRCKEKRIKCNKAKPTCDQCRRGLWVCQYDTGPPRKRSKNGCLNCRQRKRKCSEEKPSCAHCLKVDEDCEYAED